MKKAIVIYDSKFGNTEKIARSLAEGMKGKALKVDKVDVGKLGGYDLLAFGAPTQAFRISVPMKELLAKLKGIDLKGKRAFAFDTRIKKWWAGSAAKGIEGSLKKLGMEIVRPYRSAVVKGTEGPLAEGMEQEFKQIGREIAKSIQ